MFEPRELRRPYPGLRPFSSDELPIFFGREAHVSRLIEVLHQRRFLAVVGPSGAGKSSLVHAGLLPGLAMGWPGEVSDWRMAILRPGDRPLRRLAEALLQPQVLGIELGAEAFSDQGQVIQPMSLAALIEGELRSSPQALAELVGDATRSQAGQPPFNLLVLVDQFEELFRYAESGQRQVDEAETFVSLLLAAIPAIDSAARRVHVVLTMRTEALSDCLRFEGLPEALNQGQYLVPRLKDSELRSAIQLPAEVFAGSVQKALENRLIAEVRNAPDELPMLQHALSRMWDLACKRGDSQPEISLEDELEAGGFNEALSKHADAIFATLSPNDQNLADWLFRAVTGRVEGTQTDTRRPQRLTAIARFSGIPDQDWHRFEPILRAYSAEGAYFLHFNEPLGPDSVVDISHEALIRRWQRLSSLVEAEGRLADNYRRWRNRCEDHAASRGGLLTGPDLAAALAWRDAKERLTFRVGMLHGRPMILDVVERPRQTWAERYYRTAPADHGYDEWLATLKYISDSETDAIQKAAARKEGQLKQEALLEQERAAKLEAERARAQSAKREQQIALAGKRRATFFLIIASTFAALALLAAAIAVKSAASERAAARSTTLVRLALQGQAMVSLARPGGTVRGILQTLAAHRLEPGAEPYFALQSSVTQTSALKKVVQLDSGVTAFALSPDGMRIVSASTDRSLRLWYAHSGEPITGPLKGHSDRVTTVAFSPDGKRIVSGSADNSVRLWDAKSGAPIGRPLTGHSNWVNSVAFSPDGTLIVSASADNSLRRWDARTGAPIGTPLQGKFSWATSVAFSPDGVRIVSGSFDRSLQIWDSRSGALIATTTEGHSNWVSSVAYSPDGSRIVSGSWDNTLRLWDARSLMPVGPALKGHSDRITSVAFSPDGAQVISASSDTSLRRWDARTGASLGEPIRGHSNAVNSVAFNRDGSGIISGGADNTLRLWATRSGIPDNNILKGHAGIVNSVAFSFEGSRIVSGSADGSVRLWHSHSGTPIGGQLKGHSDLVNSVAVSPDGTRVVSGSSDGTMRLWDSRTGIQINEQIKTNSGAVYSVGFSPDGRRVVSGSADGTVRIWDSRTGAAITEPLKGHTTEVTSVAYNADGLRIVSGGSDDTIRLWDAQTGAPLGEPIIGRAGTVHSVGFSPDGLRIVSGSADGTVRLWDARSRSPIGAPLKGHDSGVTSVAFSPDGSHVVSGSRDFTLRVWPVLDAWADVLCSKLTRNMSMEEWRDWVGKLPYRRQCPKLPGPPDEVNLLITELKG